MESRRGGRSEKRKQEQLKSLQQKERQLQKKQKVKNKRTGLWGRAFNPVKF